MHRREQDFARTHVGRLRYQPQSWPRDFAPTLYDLQADPYGPLAASHAVTRSGDVRSVPIPGHSPGQIAITYDLEGLTLLFAADHMLRADWFAEDLAAGRVLMLGVYAEQDARETSRRLKEFIRQRPAVLLPAHDAVAASRLVRRQVSNV